MKKGFMIKETCFKFKLLFSPPKVLIWNHFETMILYALMRLWMQYDIEINGKWEHLESMDFNERYENLINALWNTMKHEAMD